MAKSNKSVTARNKLALVIFVGLYMGGGLGLITFGNTILSMLLIIFLYQVSVAIEQNGRSSS